MVRIREDVLVRAAQAEIDASSYMADESDTKRESALQLYFQRPRGDEDALRSDFQSADVNSMVTACCAQMAISFARDTVVEFEPEGEADEAVAQAESQAVNKIVMEQNLGYMTILQAVQNALLIDNGYIKVYWDKEVETFRVTHDDINDEFALGMVLEDDEPGVSRELVSYDGDKGQAVVEVTNVTKRLRIGTVRNERFMFQDDWEEQTLEGIRFCGEIHYKTRDELVRMGVAERVVEELKAVEIDDDGRSYARTIAGSGQNEAQQTALETVKVYEVYIRLQVDTRDMHARLFQAWVSPDVEDKFLLPLEMVDRVPYAVGTAFPFANKFQGESLGTKLAAVQDAKTTITRNWIDNTKNVAHGRYTYVEGAADADAIFNPVPGGGIRTKRPDAVQPIPINDVGPSVSALLDKLDKERTERGGAAIDFLSNESQFAQDTATGTERVYASKELLVSYMTRNLSESLLRQVYLLAHAELRAGADRPMELKIADRWQQVDPRQWRARSHVNVTSAATAGERAHQERIFMVLLQLYAQAMSQGLAGVLVSPEGLHQLVIDFAKNGLIDNPEKYLIDPLSDRAAQAIQDQQSQQSQMMEQQRQMAVALENVKTNLEVYKVNTETAYKYFETILKTSVDAANMEAEGITNVIVAARQAEAARASSEGGVRQNTPGNGSGTDQANEG